MVFKIVVLLALAAMLVSDAEGTCMAGFQSYQGSCYWLSRETGDYGFARSICGHFGAHLATIHSAGEDSFLRGIIRSLGSNSGACYYLGGSDLGTENIWQWEGPRKSFTYTNWGDGEPSHTHLGSICGHFGAHLATIHSAGEDSFLRTIIRSMGSNAGDRYYLGGSDMGVENAWRWEGPRKSFTYTNWGDGEPNHTTHMGDEHCLALLRDKGYTWNDEECNRECNFICEYEQM